MEIHRTLVLDIGPRPMGSPAEQRALRFAVEKFREDGLDTAYVMEMKRSTTANTNSGIAVGVKRGTSGRIIVIGGHIDSAGPEIPGADDDGSGVAVVLECARVLAGKRTESTIVFACFGGEEQGLEGSKYFVDHFEQIDSVVLMLQVDMANGLGIIELAPDTYGSSAPRWLVSAAVEEFYRLGYQHLRYPTHFFAFNYSLPRGSGSDHESFLQKGIPAIDFSTDVNSPIHTPQDNFDNFDPRGLKRSGDVVLRLVERFDSGTPSRETEQYWLYLVGSLPIALPLWMLYVLVAIAVALTAVAYRSVRQRRLPRDHSGRRKWTFPKMWLLSMIVITFAWFSSDVIGWMKGLRIPWFNDLGGYYILGLIAAFIGLVLAVRLARRLQITQCSYQLFVRAAIVLVGFLMLFALTGTKLALGPAIALVLISCAVLIRNPVLRLIFVALSPWWMVRLIVSEWSGLVFRAVAGQLIFPVASWLIGSAIVLFLTSLYILPFFFASAMIVRDTPALFRTVTILRSRFVFAALLVLFVGVGIVLVLRPSYTTLWNRSVRVEQVVNLDVHKRSVTLSSPEYLRGLRVVHGGADTTVTARTVDASIPIVGDIDTSWVSISRQSNQATAGDTIAFELTLALHTQFRPYTVSVTYSGGTSKEPAGFSSSWYSVASRSGRQLKWYSFPDTSLIVPVSFRLAGKDSVRESVEVVFDTLAYPMKIERELTHFLRRTRYTSSHVYRPGEALPAD
jgi:hypothetical protein